MLENMQVGKVCLKFNFALITLGPYWYQTMLCWAWVRETSIQIQLKKFSLSSSYIKCTVLDAGDTKTKISRFQEIIEESIKYTNKYDTYKAILEREVANVKGR